MSRDFKIDFQAWKTHSNDHVVNSIIHEIEIGLCECYLYIKMYLKKTLKPSLNLVKRRGNPSLLFFILI